MRIAVFAEGPARSSPYRAFDPAFALGRRGHAVWINSEDFAMPAEVMPDVALISRYTVMGVRRLAKRLREGGTAIVWDYDDAAHHSPHMRSGAMETQSARAEMGAMFKLANVVTTTNERLAGEFRGLGADRVRVVDNYLGPPFEALAPRAHDGVVLGWAAMWDHRADWRALDLKPVVQRLLDAHPELRVESVGAIDLGLPTDRYLRRPTLSMEELGQVLTGLDLAIAPIADTPFNAGRSSVKVKEYSAAGVPWLASPIGPYAGLGEKQGGRLVDDDRWGEELEELLAKPRLRRKLAKRAHRWGRSQLLSRHAGEWERVLQEAIELASAHTEEPARASTGR